MRKVLFVLALSSLAIAGTTSAEAAPKPSVVTAAFKTLLNTTTDSMDELDQKYEANVSALVLTATYKSATKVTLKF